MDARDARLARRHRQTGQFTCSARGRNNNRHRFSRARLHDAGTRRPPAANRVRTWLARRCLVRSREGHGSFDRTPFDLKWGPRAAELASDRSVDEFASAVPRAGAKEDVAHDEGKRLRMLDLMVAVLASRRRPGSTAIAGGAANRAGNPPAGTAEVVTTSPARARVDWAPGRFHVAQGAASLDTRVVQAQHFWLRSLRRLPCLPRVDVPSRSQ